jgi:uncharacterized membrane protein
MKLAETANTPVERMVFFSDAAVAIALTLLILPLMDGVGEAARAGSTTAEYLSENLTSLGAFALSFVLIARFWRAHHRLFALVEQETRGLFWLNMAWLFAVVFLPVATAATGALPTDSAQLCLYMGTMIAISALMGAMTILLYRHPEALAEGAQLSVDRVRRSLSFTIMLIVALVLSLTIPHVGYWAMPVLFATPALNWLLRTRPAATRDEASG